MRWTAIVLVPLIGLCPIMLCGNAVPTSPTALAERSDLIVEATITGVTPPQEPRAACHNAEVSRILKGRSAHLITVCAPLIAEFTPPTPKLGLRYKMYLKRSSKGFYTPFSYAGFRSLP